MGEYFQGRKRKLGLVTLIFACFFVVIWVRSQTFSNYVTYTTSDGDTAEFAWTVDRTGLTWSKRSGSGQYVHSAYWGFDWGAEEYQEGAEDPMKTEGTWKFYGFEIGDDGIWRPPVGPNQLDLITHRFAFWTIPHWSIVVPLTAVSAWLLISPRWKPATSH